MTTYLWKSRLYGGLAAIFVVALTVSAFAAATPNDTAKVLAGLPPTSSSPLLPLTSGAAYKDAAARFTRDWRKFEERHLSAANAWANRELPLVWQKSPVLYYPFSGPDIVYANTFFPDCRTYVLCGLEPVGEVPDLLALGPDKLGSSLGRLYASLGNVMSLSFFKTAEMGSDFRNPGLPGITPVLMTFLARMGKEVRSVDLVAVDRDGIERPRAAAEAVGEDLTPGVKIVFDSGAGTPEQTVYYFSTNISNEGLEKNPGFANFCRKLEPGAGLVKAASYLMHTAPFSATRDFLMERCQFILQDDTGIPAAIFAENKWQMRPYGRYVRPIDMFRGYFQKKLAEIHAAGDGVPLDFGVGYYYRIADCNMLLASRDEDSIVVAAADREEAPRRNVAAEPVNAVLVAEAATPSPSPTPQPASAVADAAPSPTETPAPLVATAIAAPLSSPEPATAVASPEPVLVAASAEVSPEPTPSPEPVSVVAEAAPPPPSPTPSPTPVALLASSDSAGETKSPRKKLIELEAEELRIRKDQSLSKKERMEKLRAIWKQQLAVMGKKSG